MVQCVIITRCCTTNVNVQPTLQASVNVQPTLMYRTVCVASRNANWRSFAKSITSGIYTTTANIESSPVA